MRRRHLRVLIPAFILLLCLTAWIAPLAQARKLSANTINPDAALHRNSITLTGPVSCTQVEWVDMVVTVTQRSTGAVAEGRLRILGSTTPQQWSVEALIRGDADFEPGEATAVASAITTLRGQRTDAHQWLVPITLHAE
jgi:hypothetical protein